MAEQSKPNTFAAGMITDLDPAYRPKDSYFTGLNIRVVTNGDNSYSLENIQAPVSKHESNQMFVSQSTLGPVPQVSGLQYIIHGAVVVDDYIITVESDSSSPKNWRIRKYNINATNGNLIIEGQVQGYLWQGTDLFSDTAGQIEMESVVETELIHRVYCTDGMTGLKSINVKDSSIGDSTVTDFLAFKPNPKSQIELEEYLENGGNLLYGSYSYVYRLSSQGQSNYTDWSSISKPINVIDGSIVNNTSLGVNGGTALNNSSVAHKLKITNIPNENYNQIEVAAIYYAQEDVPVINIVETSPLSSSTHEFIHSGFETTTPVPGNIAAAIITNKTWSVCKSLAKKDNKLYAANLKSTSLDIHDIIEGFGKLKSYKGVEGAGGVWSLTAHEEDFNPHRHYNGSGGNFSWSDDLDEDKGIYKFINENFGHPSSPVFVLGAETVGFSSGAEGFRMTFDHVPYKIDERFNKVPLSGAAAGDGPVAPTEDQDANELYYVGAGENTNEWGGGKGGPYNPFFDFKYRSFKRGECYRFGIVFYDKQGVPGFVHHIGDVKMPDALDPNGKKINGIGSNASLAAKAKEEYNTRWSPFSGTSGDDEGNTNDGDITGNEVWGYALIPRLEVKLPHSVTSQISGFKVVRAELTENDKTIITQGALSPAEDYETGGFGGSDTLEGKAHYPPTSLTIEHYDSGEFDAYPQRIANRQYLIDGSDVTFRNMNYNYTTGVSVKPLYLIMANRVHNVLATGNDHKHFGYDLKSDMEGGVSGTGMRLYKWKPYTKVLEDLTSENVMDQLKTTSGGSLFRWHKSTHLAKTVVQSEIITQSQNDQSVDYIHLGAGYKGASSGEQFSGGGAGDFFPSCYGDESRADYALGVVPSLYVSLNHSTSVIPLPSEIDVTVGGSTTESTSLGEYPSGDPNDHHSEADSGFRFSGFKWMVELIRNTQDGFEQYGGATIAAVESTRFYDCSNYVRNTSSGTVEYDLRITGGDVFCDWYSLQNTTRDSTDSTFIYGNVYPLESYVNVALRQGTYLGKTETASMLNLDNVLYTTSYSQENNLVSSAVMPSGFQEYDLFKAKIAASQTKILGELYDAWSVFPANDFIELPLANGRVTDLVNYKNQLYAVQDRGISLLSINARSLIQGEGAAADIQIVSGTGAAIERYDYLTTSFGSQHYNKSIVTPTGFYIFDNEGSEIVKCTGDQIIPIALTNQYKSFIQNITQGTIPGGIESSSYVLGDINQGIWSGYDPEFRECYYSVFSALGQTIFTFSDLDGKLISEHNYKNPEKPESSLFVKRFIPYKNKVYIVTTATYSENRDGIFMLNEGLRESFSFGYTVNDNPAFSKIFDSCEVTRATGGAEVKFGKHTLIGSSAINEEYLVPSNNERIRESKSIIALRGENSPRVRGGWLLHAISYNQILMDDEYYSEADNIKFDIFAISTKYRLSR